MKIFKSIRSVAIALSLIFSAGNSQIYAKAENKMSKSVVSPYYTTIPVNKSIAVYASGFEASQALVMFHINGSFDKNSGAITNIELNHSYYVSWYSGASSITVQSATVQYKPNGTTLNCICNVVIRVTINGKSGLISGSGTLSI